MRNLEQGANEGNEEEFLLRFLLFQEIRAIRGKIFGKMRRRGSAGNFKCL
jgi:hypothetical protein